MSLQRTIFQALKNNPKVTTHLTTYKDGPAIFFNRVPESMEGFPLVMVTKVSNTSGADAHWLRETITMALHVWDERTGHSTKDTDAVIREIELMFDHQALVDLDSEYASARCWFEGRTRVQEGGEKDNVIHTILTMSIIAYRQFMADVLANE